MLSVYVQFVFKMPWGTSPTPPPLLQLSFAGSPRLAPVKHFNVPHPHHTLGVSAVV